MYIAKLNWNYALSDHTGFLLQRSTDSGSTWTTNFPITSSVVSQYLDNTVVTGGTYWYQIAATNLYGTGSFSDSSSIFIPPSDAPNAPYSMSVTSGSAILHWTSGSTGQDYFAVERQTSGGGFSQITTTLITSSTDSTVSSSVGGNTYGYRVAAVNVAGTSSFSNTATITFTSAAPMVPALAPQLFTSSIDTGSLYFSSLMWTIYDHVGNATGSMTGSVGSFGNYILSSSYSGATSTASIGFKTELFVLSAVTINPVWRFDFYNDPAGSPNNYYVLQVEVNGVVDNALPTYPAWGSQTGYVQPASSHLLHTGSNTISWSVYLYTPTIYESDISGTFTF